MTKESEDIEAIEKLGKARDAIVAELRKTIVGMDEVIDEMMIAIFARGHCLLVGVPGLAKTLLVSSLAETMSLGFKRIQFTPDLMPSDITGTELLQEDPETHERRFKFQKGPVFTNLLLADEINRTPPKTQAALLEAMQEKRVSSGGEDYKLDEPFFVLATQNPIEQEGTYPLPEAQLDRFLFNIMVKYPNRAEELDIMRSVTTDDEPEVKKVVDGPTIREFQHVVRRIPVSEHVFEYAALPGAVDAAGRAGRTGVREETHGLGSGTSCFPELDRRGQSAGGLAGTLSCVHRRHPGTMSADPAPSHHPQLRGPLGGDDLRLADCEARGRGSVRREAAQEESQLAQHGSSSMSEHLPETNYLDPEVLQKLSDLELVAREVVGRIAGGQSSQPVARIQYRVCASPAVLARRRDPGSRLAGLRSHRPLLHQALRGGDEL